MTNSKRPRGQYVEGKVSKVRWLPSSTRSGKITPSHFIFGSWDEVIKLQPSKTDLSWKDLYVEEFSRLALEKSNCGIGHR